jgi:hypothetical protein
MVQIFLRVRKERGNAEADMFGGIKKMKAKMKRGHGRLNSILLTLNFVLETFFM